MPLIRKTVIIIGGGPAGSTCAWRLMQAGIETLLLDKAAFPRNKVCAGWITPKVLSDLRLDPAHYPGTITRFDRIRFHFFGIPVPLPTRQFAIRRIEFDDFLLKRAGVPLQQHSVKVIIRKTDRFVIDDRYECRYLIGAGGTHCPVWRNLFQPIRLREFHRRIETAEIEFRADCGDEQCRLWFFNHRLPGYAWYVPKEGGFVNMGIGGKAQPLRNAGTSIREHWSRFAAMLREKGLSPDIPDPKGHIYYLRQNAETLRSGNAFLVGDAAGLATLDMGEGIGPAVGSGLAAAEAIITGRPYQLHHLPRFSVQQILMPRFKRPTTGQG